MSSTSTPAGSASTSRLNSRSNSPARGNSGSDGSASPNLGKEKQQYFGKSPVGSRNSSSTGLRALLAVPSIKLFVAEQDVFLHPTTRPDEPTYDPSIEGVMDLGWQHRPYESFICLEKELTLLEEDVDTHLEKGEHIFQYSIIVPSSTAIYERCKYGRVRHTLRAKAKMSRGMGADLQTEKIIYLIANPGGAGESEPPPGMHYRLEGHDDALGPFSMALKSRYMMISGLLLFRFKMMDPPSDISIHSIKIRIDQFYLLKTLPDKQPEYCEEPPESKIQIGLIDVNNPANEGDILNSTTNKASSRNIYGPLAVLGRGQEWQVQHVLRLPNDHVLRGFTPAGTVTGIHIKHEIVVEVIYEQLETANSAELVAKEFEKLTTNSSQSNLTARSPSQSRERSSQSQTRKGKQPSRANTAERKMMTIRKPLDLYQCTCFISSLSLPPYSRDDPGEKVKDPDEEVPCLCMEPLADFAKNHMQGLLEDDERASTVHLETVKEEAAEERGRSNAR